MPYLLHHFTSEADLTRAINEVSEKFTSQRENISHYLTDERLVSAYTAFFLTTNYPKLKLVFDWLPPKWMETIKNCDFIDLGAGPGTFSLAWRALGGKGRIFQVETSSTMTKQARKLWQGLGNDTEVEHVSSLKTMPGSLLLFGHSANEMGAQKVIEYIKEIDPEHILFIEPGTKQFFPQMLQIRDYILSKQFNVLFPCPNQTECPMKNSQEDWCHQILHVKQAGDVERLSQLVKKDRRTMPVIVHAYSRKSYGINPAERIVRVLPETKFSFEWEMCHHNQLEHYQVMKRNLTKDFLKDMSSLTAGSSVQSSIVKEIEKTKRVEIIDFQK